VGFFFSVMFAVTVDSERSTIASPTHKPTKAGRIDCTHGIFYTIQASGFMKGVAAIFSIALFFDPSLSAAQSLSNDLEDTVIPATCAVQFEAFGHRDQCGVSCYSTDGKLLCYNSVDMRYCKGREPFEQYDTGTKYCLSMPPIVLCPGPAQIVCAEKNGQPINYW
jgi:hypothetical protein